MLGVQRQRNIHHARMQLRRCFIVQQLEEMPADAGFVAFCFDPYAVVTVAVPVRNHGRKAGQQTIGYILLVAEIAFRLDIAEK